MLLELHMICKYVWLDWLLSCRINVIRSIRIRSSRRRHHHCSHYSEVPHIISASCNELVGEVQGSHFGVENDRVWGLKKYRRSYDPFFTIVPCTQRARSSWHYNPNLTLAILSVVCLIDVGLARNCVTKIDIYLLTYLVIFVGAWVLSFPLFPHLPTIAETGRLLIGGH